MAGFEVDLSNVQDFGAIQQFEDGIYAARILDSKFDLNKSSNVALFLDLELASEQFGTAKIKWQISSRADFMLKPFWIAINDFSKEEFEENPFFKLDDAKRLIGVELLVVLGTKPDKDDPTKLYKNIVSPFAFPLHRYQELADAGLIK